MRERENRNNKRWLQKSNQLKLVYKQQNKGFIYNFLGITSLTVNFAVLLYIFLQTQRQVKVQNDK